MFLYLRTILRSKRQFLSTKHKFHCQSTLIECLFFTAYCRSVSNLLFADWILYSTSNRNSSDFASVFAIKKVHLTSPTITDYRTSCFKSLEKKPHKNNVIFSTWLSTFNTFEIKASSKTIDVFFVHFKESMSYDFMSRRLDQLTERKFGISFLIYHFTGWVIRKTPNILPEFPDHLDSQFWKTYLERLTEVR
jgi:hypothetical protein